MKILVAYDGSPCAKAALTDLHRAGLRREAEALVISVAERWLPVPAITHSLDFGFAAGAGAAVAAPSEDLERTRQLAAEAKAQLESYFTGWSFDTVAASGSPAREILERAKVWGADLVVLGCQGSSALGRFLLGSVSQKVLHEATCSVRVCRGTAWKNGSPVRLVIGVDGSPSSEEAVRVVASRVWPIGSEVRLVTVIDPSDLDPTKSGETETHTSADAESEKWLTPFIEAAEKRLRAADLSVSNKIEIGDPKLVLVADADEWGADCIIIGAASSPATPSTLGGVSTAVVARAHCSVEIIRAPKRV